MTGEFKEKEDFKIVADETVKTGQEAHEQIVGAIQKSTDADTHEKSKSELTEPSQRHSLHDRSGPSERNGPQKVSQKRADDSAPVASLKTRNWGGAMLTFVTANLYLILMYQVFQVVHGGGVQSWLELIKFNFLEIAGMIAFGVPQFAAQLQSAGALQSLFITLAVYWSLFLVYPIVIFGCPADGSVFSRKQTFKGKFFETLIVLFGLAVFIPLPCIRYWKQTKSEKEESEQKCDSMSNWQIFPEFFAVVCEVMLLIQVAQQLLIHIVIGQTHFRWEDMLSVAWVIPIGQIFWACVCLFFYRRKRRDTGG